MNTKGDNLKPSIGFIGMGHMSSHMAQRLLDAGYQLTVYDRTEELAALSALPEESVPNPLPNR